MPRAGWRGSQGRRTRYPNYTLTESGLQLKDIQPGKEGSPLAKQGDIVVLTWEGYTLNYKGLPFETRRLQEAAGIQIEPLRFKVGDGTVIPGLDEAVRGMREGGVRQVIVPFELGYDEARRLQPRPCTWTGQRTLDFVLDGQGAMDKTLLMNVSVKRVYQE